MDAVQELTECIARANGSCGSDLYRWHLQRIKILQNRFAYQAAADACREALARFSDSDELRRELIISLGRGGLAA
jgi:hypothetical protein